jgi:hypothetical protein
MDSEKRTGVGFDGMAMPAALAPTAVAVFNVLDTPPSAVLATTKLEV